MSTGVFDISIKQGATFSMPVVWKDSAGDPIDLTGFTARMHIRKTKSAAEVLHELTTENGGISIDGVNGAVTLTIEAVDTAAFAWRRGVYDLELVDGPTVHRILEGAVEVSPEVTR